MRHFFLRPELLMEELRNTLIFQSLSLDELRKLTKLAEVWEYSAGEAVVTQDSVSHYLYVLLQGKVDIMVRGKEKENVRVSEINKGDVFGEASMFMDMRRTASAFATGEVMLASFSREAFFEYCNESPRAGLKIMTFIIYSLLRKLSFVNKDLAIEREMVVTPEDIERLKALFPKTIDELLSRPEEK